MRLRSTALILTLVVMVGCSGGGGVHGGLYRSPDGISWELAEDAMVIASIGEPMFVAGGGR